MNAEQFKAIREKLGVDKPALAKMVGVTTRQIQMIEAGQRNPSGPLIKLMALLVGQHDAGASNPP